MLFLTAPDTVIGLLILSVMLICIFAVFRSSVGGRYLDQVISRSKAQKLIDRLSPAQRAAHFWVTCVLDTLFPVCYGLFLASFILLFAGTTRWWIAAPAALAVIADLMENVIHLMALKTRQVPSLKTAFSILKWAFIVAAIGAGLWAWMLTGRT